MNVRHTRQSDADQIFELFKLSSITKKDLSRNPKRGFYEYHLSYDNLSARANNPFSLVWENNKGNIVGYVLAYNLRDLDSKYHDSLHHKLMNFNDSVVYIDQATVHPNYSITLCSRLADTLDYILRMERIPGVVTAIPEDPWQNVSSVRIALVHGFARQGKFDTPETTLRLFTKPYLDVGMKFRNLGDHLLL